MGWNRVTTPPVGGFQCARTIILVLIEKVFYSYPHLAREKYARNKIFIEEDKNPNSHFIETIVVRFPYIHKLN